VTMTSMRWIAPTCVCLALTSPLRAQDDGFEDESYPRASGVRRSDAGGEAQRAANGPVPTQGELQAALARYAHEPSVERVVDAAVRAAGNGNASALAERARTAGWVPRVGLRARRGVTVDLASEQEPEEQSVRLSTDDDLTLEASLVFELDRVVFRSEEVALAREARAERQARAERVREVIALYFERRRLQLERDLGAAPSAEAQARIAEIEALLDVFTNGEFRRMMRARDGKPAQARSLSARNRRRNHDR
jgi:hypothetical protein